MPFAIAAAAIPAVAGIAGSVTQSNATKSAQAQAQAQFAQEQANLAPFRTAGGSALGVASDLSGANGPDAATAAMANFQTSPGYQWDLSQGLRGVDAGAASQGMLRSGATLKAEDTFSTGLAYQDYTNYYNRLYNLSALGETAAAGGSPSAIAAGTSANQAGLTQASIYGNAASGLGTSALGFAEQSDVPEQRDIIVWRQRGRISFILTTRVAFDVRLDRVGVSEPKRSL